MAKRRGFRGEYNFKPYKPYIPPKRPPSGAARADPTAWEDTREREETEIARLEAELAKKGVDASNVTLADCLKNSEFAVADMSEINLGDLIGSAGDESESISSTFE
jgi:hypothetical protein